jgi:AcrR family transcriptional regulator
MVRPRLDAPIPELHLAPALDGVKSLMGNDIGTRERMILLSIDEMLTHGPSDFNARIVCERLGVKQSMVPYHFGSRDGLIVESTIWAYRDWSHYATDILRKTSGKGEKRLRVYINAELDWASRMGPITLLVQYPMLSEPVRSRLQEKYGDEMRRKFEFHLAALADIVVDIRTGSTTPFNYDDTNYPPIENAIMHATEFLTATSISWASHGLAMWASGNHMSTQSFWKLDVGKISAKFAIKNHIDEIVATAKGR